MEKRYSGEEWKRERETGRGKGVDKRCREGKERLGKDEGEGKKGRRERETGKEKSIE